MPNERSLLRKPCEHADARRPLGGHSNWRKLPPIASILLVTLLLSAAPLSAAPNLIFKPSQNRVKAMGVTVGGDVMFLSDSYVVLDWTRRVVSRLDFRLGNSRGGGEPQ